MDTIGVEAMGFENWSVAQRFCCSVYRYAHTSIQAGYRKLEKHASRGKHRRSVSDPGIAGRRKSCSGFFQTARAFRERVSVRKRSSKSQPRRVGSPRAIEKS